jgi:hypothetical protein
MVALLCSRVPLCQAMLATVARRAAARVGQAHLLRGDYVLRW